MKPPRTGPTQRHQKQRDRNCLLSTGWLPCLPELQAASLATGSSVQEESILLSSMITAVHMISILNPLDKGFLWVARMQTNLEPKLPPITSQVQKTFYSEPYYVCANKFKLKQVPRKELLSRTRPALKSVAYEEAFTLAMTMTRKLLKKNGHTTDFPEEAPHQRTREASELSLKYHSHPSAETVASFISFPVGHPSALASESSTQ